MRTAVTLLMVRHAIALERNPARWHDDALRPLSARGIRRYRRAAAGLRHLVKPPTQVLSSPMLRARQTAAILSEDAEWPRAQIVATLAPGHRPEQTIAQLSARHGARLAIVGHEPDLGQLLAYCIGDKIARPHIEFKKGAVACIAFAGSIRAGRGALQWLLPTRVLRKLPR